MPQLGHLAGPGGEDAAKIPADRGLTHAEVARETHLDTTLQQPAEVADDGQQLSAGKRGAKLPGGVVVPPAAGAPPGDLVTDRRGPAATILHAYVSCRPCMLIAVTLSVSLHSRHPPTGRM